MADNVIDTLSIEITSSSAGVGKSVKSVMGHLTTLEDALNKAISKVSNFGTAMDSVAGGLITLDNAISQIDVGRLEKTSNALSSLSSSAKKLNGAFGNIGMDKAARDAKALETQMDKTVKSFMKANMISPEVGDKVKDLFSKFASGASFKDGAFKDVSDEGFAAYEDMIRLMMSNTLKKAQDEIDYTTRQIVEYVNSNKAKVSLPFTISDIDVGNAFNKNPKELLANVFGVGNWTTTGKGDMNLKEFIDGFNQSTGMNLNADETQQAFMALANAVLTAKEQIREFDSATADIDVDMDSVFQDLIQMTSGMRQFEASLRATSAQISGNPFEQLAQGLESLTKIGSIPDLGGVASLAENIGKLGYKNALAGIANLPVLIQGLQSLNQLGSINVPDLTGLAKFIEVISTLGYKKANNATANLRPLINGVRELATLNGLQFPTGQIASLAQSFSMLGRETTGKAVANIPQLAQAFKQLMQTLSTAPKVNSSVIALANAMAKLSASGAKVGSASRSLDASLQRMSNSMSGIGTKMRSLASRVLDFGKNLLLSGRHASNTGRHYETLASKIGLLYAKFWMLLRAVRALNGMISVASSLIEVQNVVDTTFGNMSYKIEEFSKNAIKDFGLSELSAKQYASQFQAMGTAMGITGQQVANAQRLISQKTNASGLAAGYDKASNSVADMSINLTKLTADMASFYDVEQSTVAKALQSGIYSGNVRPLRQYGLDLSVATLKEWAMNHGLNANIKSMTQAEKTILRYQYVLSQTTSAQSDFSKTANTWHNQITILKQQLQQLATVIGSGLIQAIKPFVMQMNAALSGLITFAQNVVNALGKIFGWEMEVNTKGLALDDSDFDYDTGGLEDVADAADDAADSTDKAAKAAKKLNDQLQGFDKLNVLRTTEQNKNKSNKSGTDSDSGTGNGSGVSGGEASAMLKKTKGAFESKIDNLFDLGRYISDKLRKALKDIDWDKVYETASNFGTGLAQFLNGLFDERTFEALGETVSNSLRAGLIGLRDFAMEFNFANLGRCIRKGIEKMLDTFPWKELKENANLWAQGLADLLNEAIDPKFFEKVGEALAEAINTAFEFLKTFGEDFNWENFGASLGAGLNGFLSKLDWEKYFTTAKTWGKGIANALNSFLKETDFYLLGESVSKAIKTAVLFFLSLGSTIKWKELGKALADTINGAIENFPAAELADTLDAWVQGIYDGLVSALTHVHWGSFVDKMVEFVSNVDPKTWIIVLGALKLKKAASMAITLAPDIIKLAKFEIGKKIATMSIPIPKLPLGIQNFLWKLPGTPAFDVVATDIIEMLGDAFGKAFPNVTKLWLAVDAFGKYLIEKIMHALETTVKEMFKVFNWDATVAMWETANADFAKGGVYILKGLGEGIVAGIAFLMEPIGNVFEAIWKGFCDLFGISSPAEKMKPIGQYIIQGILEGFKLPDFMSAFQWVADQFGNLQTMLGNKMNEIKAHLGTKWTEIKTSAGTFVEGIRTSVAEKWGTFKDYIAPKMTELKTAIGNKWSEIKTAAWNAIAGEDSILSKAKSGFDSVKNGIKEKMSTVKESISEKWDAIKEAAGTKIDKIKSVVGNKFKNVKKAVTNEIDAAKTGVNNVWKAIKDTAHSKIPEIQSKVTEKFNNVAKAIKKPFDTVKTFFSNIWTNIKTICGNGVVGIHNEIVSKFNNMISKLSGIGKTMQGLFKFKLPTFHFQTTTLELANLRITYPSGITATWNRKAYDNPLMFTNPTVVPTALGYQGFGDGQGGEIVYGHNNLMRDIREATGGSEMTAIGNRQLANDQRIIQLLSIIAEKEFGISGDTLFRNVRDQAQNYTNRTGKQAFEF